MYLSFARGEDYQFMHVAESDSPLGPFKNEKTLYREFCIDSHAVETEAGLFLFFAKDKKVPDYEGERIGTRVFVTPSKRLFPILTRNAIPQTIRKKTAGIQ